VFGLNHPGCDNRSIIREPEHQVGFYSEVSNFAYSNMPNAQTKQGGGSILLPLLLDGLPVFPKLMTAE
jgi:hypothetical protein